MTSPQTVSIIGLLVGLSTAGAPAADDQELERLQREYLSQRESIVRPLVVAYAEKVRALRTELEKRRDPRSAAAAAEADRLASLLTGDLPVRVPAAPAPGTTESGGAGGGLLLKASKAMMAGGAVRDDSGESAAKLPTKGAAVNWSFPALPAGQYRLSLTASCPMGASASARLIFEGQPAVPVIIQTTTAYGKPIKINLGEFSLATSSSAARFEIVTLTQGKKEVGISLIEVALQPIAAKPAGD